MKNESCIPKAGSSTLRPLTKVCLSVAVCLLYWNFASGQPSGMVTGRVTDTGGEALIGATVVVEGTIRGAATDGYGNYTIQAGPDDVLQFSCLGYGTVTVPVGGRSAIDVTLTEDVTTISDVVVTALGITRESRSLTYDVQKISTEELNRTKDANLMSSLAGKVAGVTINSSSAGIGGGARVVMRGAKSFFQNNNAIYVIDGIPMPNLSTEQPGDYYSGAGQSGDAISHINSEDIESMTVLSGASAAALYGVQAANGVVLLTTKRGTVDQTDITYSNNTTFYSPLRLPEFQSSYGSLAGEWFSWGSKLSDSETRYEPRDFFQTGFNTTNNVSLSTGTDRNQTYVSVGQVTAEGIIPNNAYDRFNFTGRNTTKLFDDRLTLDLSIMYSKVYEKNMLSQGIYGNPLTSVYLFPRSEDFSKYKYYERYSASMGTKVQYWPLGDGGLEMQNPYWITNRNLYTNRKHRFLSTFSASYKINDWLSAAGRVKIDRENLDSERKLYASTLNSMAYNSDWGGYRSITATTNQVYADAILSVDKYFNERTWSLNANVGISTNDEVYKATDLYGGLSGVPNVFTIGNISPTSLSYSRDSYHERTNAIFATASVGYKNMVFVEGSIRNDWLSILSGSSTTSVLYPSAGVSGVITDIFDIRSDYLSFAKVRFSYSEVGNGIERFRTRSYYAIADGMMSTETFYPGIDTKPERTRSYEVGLNLELFRRKLSLDVTIYQSKTTDQFFDLPISSGTGYSRLIFNAGNVRNKGFEVAAGYRENLGPVRWDANLIWSLNRNKILEFSIPEELGIVEDMNGYTVYNLGGAQQRLYQGGSLGDIYVNSISRDEHGYYIINSQTGAFEIDRNEYTKVGNSNPLYNLSLRNNFEYKGVNLGFMISARVGGVGVSATQAILDYYGASKRTEKARDNGGATVNGYVIDAQPWYQTIGAANSNFIGSEYVYSMTNVRLGELTLGYDFPIQKWCSWIKGLNVSFVGRNLFFFYCKAPFDPENTASTDTYNQGFDFFMQPSMRSLGFSARIRF
ncbi:MAG: SusC/RagA family TonB-linked outer membrane protein [Rikenellaceae bacterium]|nr:SusC/RagA family TonB-linked outer membrane protein [Rikenellaceae bacterium]